MAAATKTSAEFVGPVIFHMVPFCNMEDNSGLPPLYTALTEAAKGQKLKMVQRAVESTTLNYHYNTTNTISRTLGNNLMEGGWRMTDKLELSMGVHSFLLTQHTAAYYR